jgi:hypothetical protein
MLITDPEQTDNTSICLLSLFLITTHQEALRATEWKETDVQRIKTKLSCEAADLESALLQANPASELVGCFFQRTVVTKRRANLDYCAKFLRKRR